MAVGLLIYSHCHLIRVSNPDQQAPEAIGLIIDQATKTHKWISQHTLKAETSIISVFQLCSEYIIDSSLEVLWASLCVQLSGLHGTC